MNKTGYFTSRQNRLFFSLTNSKSVTKKTGILFVHAAEGNRLGPHRMFVETANRFNQLGYSTFRFDLAGCGDSTGTDSQTDIEPDIANTIDAVRFFQNLAGLGEVIIFAISKGSLVAFNTMVKHNLSLGGLILLSIPVSNKKAAKKAFKSRLKEYSYKLSNQRQFRRLLSGKVDILGVYRTLCGSLKLSRRYPKIITQKYANNCPVLFIYGGCDPVMTESVDYYTKQCRAQNIAYDCHIIKEANHSFFHYQWKEQVLTTAQEWLENLQ